MEIHRPTLVSVNISFHAVLLTLNVVQNYYQQLITELATWQLQAPEAEI